MLTILSEFFFTLYTDIYGIANVIEHLFNVLSFYLIYRSVIVKTLKRPFDILYGELKETKAILQSAMDQSPVVFTILKAPEGMLQYVHSVGLVIRGDSPERVVHGIGMNQYVQSWKTYSLEGTPLKTEEIPLSRAIMFGEINTREFIVRRNDNEDGVVLANAAPIKNDAGGIMARVIIFQDITDRKRAEENVVNLLREKEIILKEVRHRIKNNLGTIVSLLLIQADMHDDLDTMPVAAIS